MHGNGSNGHARPERRANPRTRLRDLACVHVGQDNGAIVLDSSDRGIHFYAVAPLEQTGIIQLTFSLWDDRRVDAVARLAWIDDAKQSGGLEFISVPAEVREYIGNCCPRDSFPSKSEKKAVLVQPASDNHRSSMAARILAAEEMISRAAEQAPVTPQAVAKVAPAQPKPVEHRSNGSNESSKTRAADAVPLINAAPPGPRPDAEVSQVVAKVAPAQPKLVEHRSNGSNGSSKTRAADAALLINAAPPGPKPNAEASQAVAKIAPAQPKAPERSSNDSNGSKTPTADAGVLISIAPPGPRPNADAWKKMIGQKPVTARLSTLPVGRLSGSALASSAALEAFLVAMMLFLPAFFPQKLVTKVLYDVVPIASVETAVPLPPKAPVVRSKPQVIPPAEPIAPQQRVAKLTAPRILTPPKPKPLDVRTAELPEISQPITPVKIDPPTAEPALPREPVKTGLLTTGSAAAPTVVAPIAKVQTGGFGDPNGLPGQGDPNQRPNIAHFGSPALPSGPGEGNGSGGASGIRGTVASAGFGNGVAVAPQGGPAPARGEVKSGGFAAAVADSGAPRPKASEAPAAVQPVVILEKPNPVYSEEARHLAIEGEVLVEVIFPASGPVQIVRVVKGLGHGLDEAATRAAQQIRFKPAVQNGQPVNFPAVVHIVFQLAF
jgi:TonB family protein